ncbi:MAG: DNA repair exonuclease [Actinomycetota bacterium]|nr:DNA repair exonuclease [Actinomycetota bacterium]
MKFVHTADLHLGKSFASVGQAGKELREGQFAALGKTCDLVRTEGADALVIAGDLFDSNEVSSRTIKRATAILSKIAPVPVIIIAGTHDVLDEGSVYHRGEFAETPNVKILGKEGQDVIVGNTAFHGRSNDTKEGGVHPLQDLSPDHDAEHNIAVIHASVEIEGKSNPNDYLVSQDEVAASGMDYVALGHWHRKADFTSGGVAAWYPGAPECTKYDEADGAGQVLIVEIEDTGVKVQPCDIGRFTWLDEPIDLSVYPPGGPLESEIKSRAGENVLIRVRLQGVLPRGQVVDPAELEEELSGLFCHLEVDDSGVGLPLDDVEGLFAEGTIGALFIEQLKERIEQADSEEEKELLQEALYLGAGYIAGDLEVN